MLISGVCGVCTVYCVCMLDCLVRRRKVIETNNPSVETLENGNVAVEFTLRCESGTYVKETIHGDDGRTQPSMASLIKAKCTVEWLDVGDIHAD